MNDRTIEIVYHKKNTARLECSSSKILQTIRAKYQFKNLNARFSTYALPFNNPISMVGTFPIYLTPIIYRAARLLFRTVSVKVSDEILEYLTQSDIQKLTRISYANNIYTPRDYQIEAVDAWLKNTHGILHMSVGSGKSLCAFLLCRNIDKKHILLVVPNVGLVTQMYKDFREYGYSANEVQKFGSSNREIGPQKVIIVNQQYLLLHKKELPKIDILIIDEAHSCSSTGNKITKWIKTVDVPKFGMTGTMPKDGYTSLLLQGLLGPVVYTKNTMSLQEQQYVADIQIKPIKIVMSNPPIFPAEDYNDIVQMYRKEQDFFETSRECANIITALAGKMTGNTIVFADRVAQVELMYKIANRKITNKKVHIMYGQTEKEVREEVKSLFQDNNDMLVIANSTVWGVGISIKNVTNIVLLGGYSNVRIVQNIGRAIRLHEDKTHANIYDVFFNIKYSSRHFTKRKKLYVETFGKECVHAQKVINI